MLPLIAKGDPGIDRAVIIDGFTLSVMPADMEVTPTPISDYLDMLDGGAREFQRRPHFDGIANHMDRYSFAMPYGALQGEDRETMEYLRVRGGVHILVLWRMVPIVYTVRTGLSRYYFPRFRKCAAWVYDGLAVRNGVVVGTDVFPTLATLDGVELTVTYEEGPTLADPGAGGIVIARQADTTGPATDYTAFRLGDALTTGDELVIWTAPAFSVSMRAPRIQMRGQTEDHAYTFDEV